MSPPAQPTRFRAPTRVWALAGGLLTLAGCAWAIASLWYPWAVDGPYVGVAADLNGWGWMRYGDVLLVVTVGCVLALVSAMYVRSPARRTIWSLGFSALCLMGVAAAGAGFLWWLTGFDFIVMDPGDYREYGRGGGPRRAVEGLAVAQLGVVCAMRSRLRRPTPAAAPSVLPTPMPKHTATL